MTFFIKQNSDIPVLRVKIDGADEMSNVKFNLIDEKTNLPVLINSEGYIDGNVLCYKFSKNLTRQVKTLIGYFTFTYKNVTKKTNNIEIVVIESFSNSKICCK